MILITLSFFHFTVFYVKNVSRAVRWAIRWVGNQVGNQRAVVLGRRAGSQSAVYSPGAAAQGAENGTRHASAGSGRRGTAGGGLCPGLCCCPAVRGSTDSASMHGGE